MISSITLELGAAFINKCREVYHRSQISNHEWRRPLYKIYLSYVQYEYP